MAIGTDSLTQRSRSPRDVTTLLCLSFSPATTHATRLVRHAAAMAADADERAARALALLADDDLLHGRRLR
ncbi:Os12g0112100 [Oryza sativa Japonica Group]|uniref:Os12g0112100 protein n=1 Tax=Oryza sativa subsp. japonica TaxID=39947 RepID=A0A0N7KTG7_ORYSJ|nr:Os12g0112100 [Oryza sativa Japonica Group]